MSIDFFWAKITGPMIAVRFCKIGSQDTCLYKLEPFSLNWIQRSSAARDRNDQVECDPPAVFCAKMSQAIAEKEVASAQASASNSVDLETKLNGQIGNQIPAKLKLRLKKLHFSIRGHRLCTDSGECGWFKCLSCFEGRERQAKRQTERQTERHPFSALNSIGNRCKRVFVLTIPAIKIGGTLLIERRFFFIWNRECAKLQPVVRQTAASLLESLY